MAISGLKKASLPTRGKRRPSITVSNNSTVDTGPPATTSGVKIEDERAAEQEEQLTAAEVVSSTVEEDMRAEGSEPQRKRQRRK